MAWRMVLCLLGLCLLASPAFAHASGRGFVMMLPVGYVMFGGALAVLVSFVALSLLPRRGQAVPQPMSQPVYGRWASLAGLLVFLVLIIMGLIGPHDPAENLLPLGVWTLWWVVIVLLHPLFGNLWSKINPFTGLHALVTGTWTRTGTGTARCPPLRYPAWASYWPSVAVFFAFAWFQLVYPAPEDADVLAAVVGAYLVLGFLGVLLFGPEAWLGRADPFAVFQYQLGAAAPLGNGGLRLPGVGLLALPPLPLSGMLFILLTLSAISFDGFSHTFAWLSLISINPLDFPGRTAVLGANTLGLFLSFLVLTGGFLVSVWLGWEWSGRSVPLAALCGRLVYSLIPISIVYHFAHYLSYALVELQYLALALNDPFASGADLFGIGSYHVTASFQNTASGARMIFLVQTVAIIVGHVIGVAVARAMVAETGLPGRAMARLELPLAICMVLYTAFGLWLLGAPMIG